MELVKKFNKKHRFIEPSILKRTNEIVESPVLNLIGEIPPLGVGFIIELRFGNTIINTMVQSINITNNIDYSPFGVPCHREENLNIEITFRDNEHLNTIFNNFEDIYKLRIHHITNGVLSNTSHMTITGGEIQFYQDSFVVSFDGRYEN